MTKVYPNAARACVTWERQKASTDGVVLTVWNKSLLPNCNGFTVFDSHGNLVFRVDNYIAANKDEILLMDAAGIPLLTIRRKRLSLVDNWLVFEGEGEAEASIKPLFRARKHVNILNTKCLAHVLSDDDHKKNGIAYEIEGSYAKRCCTFYDNKRRKVAEIKRKEAAVAGGVAFGADVFRLIIEPDMDTTLAMAFVILLDQMFGSGSSSR
ncbi:protein LURP-one-related 8-like isoform X2 [Gastrolobium bilobum]|uniref:protein LURP-one-related 8-like isoform X2 n=1 Tax=Gastrolobium bilobum TaxID=150636 RepID=UPI002AB02599|nr:protein LURP-one-related 8-like isoform X2 [Gastrolobium bilobum]